MSFRTCFQSRTMVVMADNCNNMINSKDAGKRKQADNKLVNVADSVKTQITRRWERIRDVVIMWHHS